MDACCGAGWPWRRRGRGGQQGPDPGDARPGGQARGLRRRYLRSLRGVRGALAHDLLRWRLRLAGGRPGGRAAGLAERRRRVHCGAAAGRELGRRRRRRRRSRAATREAGGAPTRARPKSAPALGIRQVMRVRGLGRRNSRRQEGVRRGQREKGHQGTPEPRWGPEKGAHGREREGAREGGCGGGGGGQSAAFLGEVLNSDPGPSICATGRRARAGRCSRSPVPSCHFQSPGLSAPDPLTKDWSRCPGRQQGQLPSGAGRQGIALSDLITGTWTWLQAPLKEQKGAAEVGAHSQEVQLRRS